MKFGSKPIQTIYNGTLLKEDLKMQNRKHNQMVYDNLSGSFVPQLLGQIPSGELT